MNIYEIEKQLKKEIASFDRKLVVLDDDPTGTQTVHDVSVFTEWSKETLVDGLKCTPTNMFYILTNSRAMSPEETTAVHGEIMTNLLEASEETGVKVMVISRSDSTLRGHYPLEPELIREALEKSEKIDGEIICPFFLEGGRVTAGDIHYVIQNGERVPAAETEFAKDEVFGYKNSNLKEYIEEKTGGQYKAKDVCSISLESIRSFDVDGITSQLKNVTGFGKVIVNLENYDDLKVFVLALYRAMKDGKTFVGRTAASIVKVMGGIEDIPLLTAEDLCEENNINGGIVMIGSYTQKTTEQLKNALTLSGVQAIEFDTNTVLKDGEFEAEVNRVIEAAASVIKSGLTAIVYTGRNRICFDGESSKDILNRSVKISYGVQDIVKRMPIMPKFIIAKGGITSSDIATKAMGIKKAIVAGQISPGIPVWKSCEENRFKSIPYVIFPGNVGNPETLKNIIERLTK